MAQRKRCLRNPTDVQRFLDDSDSDFLSSSSSDDSEIQIWNQKKWISAKKLFLGLE